MSTIGDLTPRHIGRRVHIRSREAVVTGVLTDLRVETDWIEDVQLGHNPDDATRTPGRRTVTVAVGPWVTERLPLDTPVEVTPV